MSTLITSIVWDTPDVSIFLLAQNASPLPEFQEWVHISLVKLTFQVGRVIDLGQRKHPRRVQTNKVMPNRKPTVSVRLPANWAHFDHDADIGVRGSGPTLAEAFEQAALAMIAIVTDANVEQQVAVSVNCQAPDREMLFVDWLNALVFEMATRQMLFSRFEVELRNDDGWHLQARAWGETVDRVRHAPAVEIKGATFTELSVRQDAEGIWHARCVLDV